MQDIVTYLNDNFNRFQTSKRTFKNEKGEEIEYHQLQIVVGINETERFYDVKPAGVESKVLMKADARNSSVKL